MKDTKLSTFFLIWVGFTILLFMFNPGKPTAPTPQSVPGGVHTDVKKTGPVRLTGKAVDVTGKSARLSFGPDGAWLSQKVLRFDEEILGGPFIFEDVKHQVEATNTPVSAWPNFTGGVHVGKLPLIPSDASRKSLVATSTVKAGLYHFETTDPDGKVLPKGLTVVRDYKVDAEGYHVDLDVKLKNTSKDVVNLSGESAVYLQAGPLLEEPNDVPEVFALVKDQDRPAAFRGVSAALTETTTDTVWLGVRDQFYVFLLDHRAGPGVFVHHQVPYVRAGKQNKTSPIIGFRLGVPFLKAGAEQAFKFRLYCGPKVEAALGSDYITAFNNWEGITGPIGRWMFNILQFFHSVTGSYGVAILLLTLMVKLLLHPLSFSQTVNMQRMQQIQPKVKKLKELYKDPQELQQATIKLYQDHNVNPLGGCLPVLVQIPIFIALYACLRGSFDLKGQSFWWMMDLSKPDSTTILPLLFAVSIFFSSKMTQQPAAGMDADQQAAMNKMMPIMMYGMFVFMPVPAGVMIYMAVQSVLGVAETRYNLSKIPKMESAKAGKKGKGKKAREE